MALETKCQENARAIAQQMKNSGGGSGSDVTVTQVLESGTKIASIKVDNVTTDLYCETVPATMDADDVNYDNTDSGLTATNVQDAIDEVSDAENIAYDNTTSGLTATNVQDAIDEVAQGGGGGSLSAVLTINGDGVKTFGTIAGEIGTYLGSHTLSPGAYIEYDTGTTKNIFHYSNSATKSFTFMQVTASAINFATLSGTNATWIEATGTGSISINNSVTTSAMPNTMSVTLYN